MITLLFWNADKNVNNAFITLVDCDVLASILNLLNGKTLDFA